jgi:alpha-tubulin suppressor-like RCC1 family protein
MAGNLQVNGVDFDNYYIPNTSFISYNDKTFWAWGDNTDSIIPDGTSTSYSSPIQIGILTGWTVISFSPNQGSLNAYGFGGGVKSNGSLWTWGRNNTGQLGTGDRTHRSSPVQVGTLTNWSSINCGGNAVAAIKTDGTLWTWGSNNYGRLGLNDVTHRSSPVQVGAGTTWSKVSVGGGSVNGDDGHMLAIKTDGTLWAWGYNINGQLGLGDTTHRSSPVQVGALTTWASVATGRTFSLAIKTDGTLWAWGGNASGQLGQGDIVHRSSPVQVGALTTWSKVTGGGEGAYSGSTLAIKTDGTLWSWGYNNSGQLGQNDIVHRSSPVQVGALTTWSSLPDHLSRFSAGAIKTDGTLWVWGSNSSGQLGQNNLTNVSSPVQVGTYTNWNSISFGTASIGSIKNGL